MEASRNVAQEIIEYIIAKTIDMQRRNFLKTLGGIAVMSQIPVNMKAKSADEIVSLYHVLTEISIIEP